MVARWLLLVCLIGCDQTWGLVHVTPHDSGGVDTLGTCPESYELTVAGFSSRYRYEGTATTWDAAEALCAADSTNLTHLIVLDDEPERTGLLTTLAQNQVTASVWIGLTDRRSEGVWQWVTDQPVGMPPLETPPWGAGQPDAQTSAQDCVRIQGATSSSVGFFDDGECSSIFDYVCECDGQAPQPNNF